MAGLFLCLLPLALPKSTQGAGATIITHGLNSNVDDWVIAMAERMTGYPRFPGATSTCYELYFTNASSGYALTWRRLGGEAPAQTDSGELLIKLDWRQLANNDYSTIDVAALVAPRLWQTNFIEELNGHALAELPLHLIGHSRGGSLISQLSQLLGTNGLWVDHLTTLDPHPLNNDGFFDFPYTVVDAPVHTYANVLFHDNYYQTLNFLFNGEPVNGAYVRQLTNLDGGYGGLSASHSDVHLWYHGTVDLRVTASDTVATITSAERQKWWTAYEAQGTVAGFYYSLIGGGDRLSSDRPAGSSGARPRDGHNQRWDLGAGLSNNRTNLPRNGGDWPNLIRFDLAGTNSMAQGQSNRVTFAYQWARPVTETAIVQIFLDDDFNPFNGTQQLVSQWPVTGTTSDQIGSGLQDINVAATNSSPGTYALCASITGGGRTRYLYAPQLLTVLSSSQSPRLTITQEPDLQIRIDVSGVPGQRVVLQQTLDFQNWQPLATNLLSAEIWSYRLDEATGNRGFFRAEVR